MLKYPRLSQVLISIAILITTASMGFAATWTVRQDGTGDFTTVAAAYAASSPGDIILVGPGLYPEQILMTHGVTIQSETGPDATIIEGIYDQHIFEYQGVSSAHIEGLTFRNAFRAVGDAGAVYPRFGSVVSIVDCTFDNNHAGYDCGAIYVRHSGSHATITDCRFTNNSAGHNGGAIGVGYGATATIVKCTFIQTHHCTHITGAVMAFQATMDVSDCLFLRNSAEGAGALRYYQSSGTVRNNTFHDNTSQLYGTVSITSSPATVFEQNIVTCESHTVGLEYVNGLGSHACNDSG